MSSGKRPATSPNTPRVQKKTASNLRPSGAGYSSSSTSTALRPEFRQKEFFIEHTIDLSILGDHLAVTYAKSYIERVKLEALYTPPSVMYPNLVRVFHQNISFPESEGVQPFVVASVIGKTKIEFTPDEIAKLLDFPIVPPEGVPVASLTVPQPVLIRSLAGGESGPGGCTWRADAPAKLWLLDHLLKRNLFQPGHSQQRISYFQQVLYAALRGEWFHYGQMMARVMKQTANTIAIGGKKASDAHLPYPRTISFLLQCKYENLTLNLTPLAPKTTYTMTMWRNSLVKLEEREEERKKAAKELKKKEAAERAADVASAQMAPPTTVVAGPSTSHSPLGETAFQRRARYEHLDSLAQQLLAIQFMQIELHGCVSNGQGNAAWQRASAKAARGGLMVPPPGPDEDDDGRSFRGIGLRDGGA